MPKERSINPAQAQRKAEKAKAIKKGKAEAQARKDEKLARRNPDRLQKQLDDLKAIESSGGKLTSHEKSVLEGLEKEIKAVRKARETLGDAAPKLGRGGFGGDRGDRGGRGGGVLGKRRRGDEGESSESDVPEDVRSIPMPRDTPPPIPKEALDKWYQRRRERNGHTVAGKGTNANNTPLGQDRIPDRPQGSASPAPVTETKTVYEAKPIIRDLRKEAVSAFVPAAVRMKMDKAKGSGGLVEPEEADALERAGYMARGESSERRDSGTSEQANKTVMMEEVDDEDG
ncbi:hypothetical protein BP5796_01716 [Coleophoma crateriformis]|uniref:Wbp11/ELF5/Saf1 N-terminal domain-containing protein n=1 Tax=Coleophoma crateriformis TaxID=565419 RepID=A0A3D8T170_9HELO|nr:hypothetical protein BP5796_01716 [Coleophoma crateriformis]